MFFGSRVNPQPSKSRTNFLTFSRILWNSYAASYPFLALAREKIIAKNLGAVNFYCKKREKWYNFLMKTRSKNLNLPLFFKSLFWSHDFSSLNPQRHRKTIILNSINYGEWKHWIWIVKSNYRNFNNSPESLSTKAPQAIAQKNGGSRPKAVEGGCFPSQYVLNLPNHSREG